MQHTTESKCATDIAEFYFDWVAPREPMNPKVSCHESRHTEEPEHHKSGGLDNPFMPKKVVDTDTEGVLS